MKEICKELTPNTKASSINAYKDIINRELDSFTPQTVVSPKFNLTFQPWNSWSEGEPPFWWISHNKVKHRRAEFYSRANLKNVLESLAGLYVANIYLNFVVAKKSNGNFIYSISDSIPSTPVELGFYRIDCLFAYINE